MDAKGKINSDETQTLFESSRSANDADMKLDPERGNCLMLFKDKLEMLSKMGSEIYTPVIVSVFEWYTRINLEPKLNQQQSAFYSFLLDGAKAQSLKYLLRCEKNSANARKRAAKKQAKNYL